MIAVGAPEKLFGAENAPTFAEAFQTLSTAGFDAFFPFFARTEIDEQNKVSDHFEYFLPSSFGGTYNSDSNPYESAKGKLPILFPAFFFSDATGNNALNEEVFKARFNTFKNDCWGGNEDAIFGYETCDEVALKKTVNTFTGQAGPLVENVIEAYKIMKSLSEKPIFIVEGVGPFLIEREPLSEAQKQMLLTVFWDAVSLIVTGTDVFGFDVYPVPNDALTVSGDYVRESKIRSPTSRHLVVLQGFSRRAESGGAIDERGPNLSEMRFMAFDAIVGGASYIMWYGGSYLTLSEEDTEMWTTVLQSVLELKALNPWLVGTDFNVNVPENVEILARQDGGHGIIILVNRATSPARLSLQIDVPFDVIIDESNKEIENMNQTVNLSLDGYGVKILRFYSCEETN